jgi:hypothetical protein
MHDLHVSGLVSVQTIFLATICVKMICKMLAYLAGSMPDSDASLATLPAPQKSSRTRRREPAGAKASHASFSSEALTSLTQAWLWLWIELHCTCQVLLKLERLSAMLHFHHGWQHFC